MRGKTGNQINFPRNGKYYTKSVAKSYRLSEGSRKSSLEFADASKGKIVEFVYPEKIVVKEEENLKGDKISWKLHNQ